MTIHGMDVDAVERMGSRLQNECATRLRDLSVEIDQLVEMVVGPQWVGPDADRFRSWWPEKRSVIRAAAEDLHGFGQSALNNAIEQRNVSGISSPASTTPESVIAPPQSSPRPPEQGGNPSATSPSAWGANLTEAEAKRIADEHIGEKERLSFDFHGEKDGDGDWYQCTSWAKARWRQMGYDGPNWYGDGGDVAANINRMRGTTDSGPSVGAIVSMPGHVAVVEEMRTLSNGEIEFRISEMNAGGNGWRLATADEFRNDRWFKTSDRDFSFASFSES